jgi:hypothetical protein
MAALAQPDPRLASESSVSSVVESDRVSID